MPGHDRKLPPETATKERSDSTQEVVLDELEEVAAERGGASANAGPAAASPSVDALLSELDADLADALESGRRPPVPREPTAAIGTPPDRWRPAPAAPGVGLPRRAAPPSAADGTRTSPGAAAAPSELPGRPTKLVSSPPAAGPRPRPTSSGVDGSPSSTSSVSAPGPRPGPTPPGAKAEAVRRPASIPPPLARRQAPRADEAAGPPRAASRPPPSPSSATSTRQAAARESIEAWERELAMTRDPLRQARLHYEIARTAEIWLQDLRRAAAHYEAALARAPEHIPSIRGARRVAIARKSFQAALPLFDAEARITADPRRKAAILHEKGRLLEDVLGQKSEARREYAIAAELDRGHPTFLKALEQCDADAGSWEELARTYERAANAVASDPRHRAALIVQRARLLEVRHDAIDAAAELYEMALGLDPEVGGAIEALKRLHHRRRRWRDLIASLEREAAHATDRGARAMAHYRIGRLHAERLGNRDEAIAALERAAAEAPAEPLVLEELARLYEAAERWELLVRTLEQIVDTLPTRQDAGAPERVALLVRIGQIREERLADPQGARAAYEAALELAPTHVPALQALGAAYARSGDWERLVRMHMNEAEHAEDPTRRAAAHARVGDILETHLGRPEQAIEHHARALALAPGYPPSFKALTRLLTEAGRWRELVDLYARAVDESSEPERAIAYLLKIGAIYEDALGEPAQAAHAYRRVLDRDPKHLGAIHALQRATERAGRWSELASALELEAELSRDPRQVVALLHRAGDVLDEFVGDREAAIARFRKVLGIDPRYVPALTSLGRIYHRAGRWEDLLELYRRQLERTPRGPEAVALLAKMGEICEERIGRDEEAVACYRRAIEIDPTNQTALRALARKLRERGSWEELAEVLQTELQGLTDPAARARAAYRLGEVWEERLGRIERAVSAYEQAREAEPGYRPAIDALARLRAEQGAWRKLVEDLEKEAVASHDPKLAVSALLRAGEIWAERLNEPRRACAAYERVLEREPENLAALLSLEALQRRLASFEGLARTYASEARVFSDPHARVAALHELARLQQARLGAANEETRATYEAILALCPDDAVALAALERLAIADGATPVLAAVDGRLAAQSTDPVLASAYRTRLAEAVEEQDDARAIEEYRRALEADPENLGAARGLARTAARTADPETVAEAARHEARLSPDPQRAAKLLVRAGIVTERSGDPLRALADYERALELWPDDVEAAQRLLEIMLAAGRGEQAADRLARAAQSARTSGRAAELWLEVARLQADLLDNLSGAIASLQRAVKASPNHVPALRRLAELHERDGQWSEAATVLGRIVQLAPEPEVLKDAHLRLSALFLRGADNRSKPFGKASDGPLWDPARARVSIQAVLALEPDNRQALSRLVALHEHEGDFDKAAEVAERLVAAARSTAQRAEAMVELARIERRRGRSPSAERALLEAVALEGPGGEAARAFRSEVRDRDGYAAYAHALREHIRRWDGRSAAPRQAWVELAAVLGDSLGQHAESVQVLREATRALPDDVDLDRQLAARLVRMGQGTEATAILRRRVEQNALRIECWRDLRVVLASEPPVAALLLAPIALTGEASAEEIEALRARAARPAHARPGSMGPQTLAPLYEMDPGAPLLAVLATLPEALERLYPPDLEGFGLSARDKITSRSGHPLRALTDRLAAIFDVAEHDLYVHRVRARGVAIELGEPISILVPAFLSELSEAAQVFLLSRAFANVAMGLSVVDKLTPREVEVLVASAVRTCAPGFGAGLTSDDVLDEQARRIQKALSRRARRALEEAARRYVASPALDVAPWARRIHVGAARAALLVADDLVASVDALRRTERDLANLETPELLTRSPLVAELVRFWASEPAIELRRRAGMLP